MSGEYKELLKWAEGQGLPIPPATVGLTAPGDAGTLETFANTDLGNAERLIALHGLDLRFAPELGWLAWTGQRWWLDSGGEVHRRAFDVVRQMYRRAQELIAELAASVPGGVVEFNPLEKSPEAEARQKQQEIAGALLRWARTSESRGHLEGMIVEAQFMCEISASQLDVDIWLLNLSNGTLDLRSGELKPHNREDLLTKMAPVNYDKTATYELWDNFLARILPDIDRREFVQRALGYSATGSAAEERLFFAYGPTATGKSTLFRAIQSVLGDYAATASFGTFLEKQHGGGIPNDIARLAGKRLVNSIEVESGQKLAEGLVKMITGGDVITARFLHHEFFEFVPQFTLWLAANHRPRVKDDDDAIWRRIVQIPFDVQIPAKERDETMKQNLTDAAIAGPAILRWLVEGCLSWQKIGLAVPASVNAATAEYRAEMDPLVDFLEECCVFVPDAITGNADLWHNYVTWAKDAGHRFPLGRKSFTQRMDADARIVHEKSHDRRWRGIGIISGKLGV